MFVCRGFWVGGGKGFLFADQAGSATVKDLSQQKIKNKHKTSIDIKLWLMFSSVVTKDRTICSHFNVVEKQQTVQLYF